ncbi:MAG TPA: SCO family protein [Pyrinomonadaceae bacterium]|jgi:protein SCO1/2
MISHDEKTGTLVARRLARLSTARRRRRVAALVVLALSLLSSARAYAQQTPQPAKGADQCHQTHVAEAQPQGGPSAAAKPSMPDVEVTDQDGRKSRFYTDLVKGKVVIINFVFTSCTYVCPMQGANFAKLQAALGDRLGRDVSLISVSTDPVVDTPARLKAWGERFGAKPGWTLVTGGKDEMEKLLRSLTGDGARRGEHSPVALLGDFERGAWVRAYGLSEPERYLELLSGVRPAPAAQASAGKQ